jgi:ABC-type glycerol-3-phosphate transport system substrate-binding protein
MSRRRSGLTRRSALSAGVPGLGAVALASCGAAGQGGESAAPQKAPRSVPITLWARSISDQGVFDAITPLAERRYPHLAVSVEIANDIFGKLATALAANSVPDLSVINRQFGQPFYRRGAFVDLQPLIGKDKKTADELKQFAPAALEAHSVGKLLYAIPTTNESIVCWYNEDLLRQQNLRPPHEFEDDPQRWNWDTLLDYARKLNRGQDQDRAHFGLWAGITNVQTSWGNFVYSNGGRIITDDGAKLTLSEPPTVEAIQWAVDTIWKHDVQPRLATVQATPNRTLFQQGRLAMLIEGEFFRRYLYGPQTPQGTPFAYNLAQIPFAPHTKQRHIVFNSLGLPALKAGRSDAAWEYLTVFATKDAQQFITDKWGSRGGHKLTYEPWLKSNADGGQPANYAAIPKGDAYGKPQLASQYLWQNELQEPLLRILPRIYDNEVPVRSGLQQIDQETNQRLAAAGAPQR